MDAKRIKTVLIILLLAANIMLGSVVGYRAYQARSERTSAARAAVAALDALGTIVDEELLLSQPSPLYIMEEERSVEREFAVLGALVGATASDFVELGSGIYHAETDAGVVRISNAGLFEVVYSAQTKESDEAYISLSRDLELQGGTQPMNGSPIFNRSVGYYTDGDSISINGGLLLGEMYTISDTPSKSAESALLALSGALDRAGLPAVGDVTACELGYNAELAAHGYTAMRPVWRIESTAGVYYVDAITLLVTENG